VWGTNASFPHANVGLSCQRNMSVDEFCRVVAPVLVGAVPGCPTTVQIDACDTLRCTPENQCVNRFDTVAEHMEPACIPYRTENETCGQGMAGDLGKCDTDLSCICPDLEACAMDAPHVCVKTSTVPPSQLCCTARTASCESLSAALTGPVSIRRGAVLTAPICVCSCRFGLPGQHDGGSILQ
jgi:hypothetical protein